MFSSFFLFRGWKNFNQAEKSSLVIFTVADYYIGSGSQVSGIRRSRCSAEGLSQDLKNILQILGRCSWDQISGRGFRRKLTLSIYNNRLLHQCLIFEIKGTVMQIEKALINDRLRVSKVSWKFHIPTIYNFEVIYPWNLLFS